MAGSLSLGLFLGAANLGQGVRPPWVPQGASAFFDFDNDLFWRGVTGSEATLVTPYVNGGGGYVFPLAALGVTGQNLSVYFDIEFPTVPATFDYIAAVANAGASNRVSVVAYPSDKIGADLTMANAYVDGTQSAANIVEDLRLTIGLAIGGGSFLVKFGAEATATVTQTMPTDLSAVSFGCSTLGLSPSGIIIHSITAYNAKLADLS